MEQPAPSRNYRKPNKMCEAIVSTRRMKVRRDSYIWGRRLGRRAPRFPLADWGVAAPILRGGFPWWRRTGGPGWAEGAWVCRAHIGEGRATQAAAVVHRGFSAGLQHSASVCLEKTPPVAWERISQKQRRKKTFDSQELICVLTIRVETHKVTGQREGQDALRLRGGSKSQP